MYKTLILILLLTHSLYVVGHTAEPGIIFGTQDDDNMLGSSNPDEIHAGDGNDTINGGKGADKLFGGDGADTFVVDLKNIELDTVYDFSVDENDSILLNLDDRSSFDVPNKLTVNDVKVDIQGNLKIYLENKEWRTIIKLHPENVTQPELSANTNLKESDITIKVKDQKNVNVSSNFKLKQSDLLVDVEDKGNRVKITFKRNF